jgi:hypothetical protein
MTSRPAESAVEPRSRRVSYRGAPNKGRRAEREVAAIVGGKRTPLSGGAGGNDITTRDDSLFNVWGIEVKARANLPALLSAAMRQAEVALPLGSPRRPAVVLKADGERPLFVARLEDVKVWIEALAETGRGSKVRELARQLQAIATELRGIG